MPAQNNPFVTRLLAAEPLATEAQLGLVATLIAERNWVETLSGAWARRVLEIEVGAGAPLTKVGASKLITTLFECPKHVKVVAPEFPNVLAGRYAVETEDGAVNELGFYKVDRPVEGKWAGRIFVKLMQSDDEIRLSREAQASVLAKIAVDPAAASAKYGHEIGECGVCGRTLTNDESRARGIGPVCASKAGW